MTVTQTYSKIHNVFAFWAEAHGITPYDVRVLVAVAESEGKQGLYPAAPTDYVQEVLSDHNGSSVRRSVLDLYKLELAEGRGIDGKERRPGTRTLVILTSDGFNLVRRVLYDLGEVI